MDGYSPKPSPYGLAEDEVDCLATRSQADQKPSSELFIFRDHIGTPKQIDLSSLSMFIILYIYIYYNIHIDRLK